ncbi:MAG TPA: hypothetical protein VGJ05_18910 [Fimbriiglobus sp.]|jgi:hypothetical protein
MHDDSDVLDLSWNPKMAGRPLPNPRDSARADESEDESCPAFGFLRGLRDRSLMLEFRLKNGNTEAFSYHLLSSIRYNPSVGLLLKFSGDVVTLVLIHGSNLDFVLKDRAVNLTDRGIYRHRVTFVREMNETELSRAGANQPTIDHILLKELDSIDEQTEWIQKTAPVFL